MKCVTEWHFAFGYYALCDTDLLSHLHSLLSQETELSLDCLWLTSNCKYHRAAEEGERHYFISHCKHGYKLRWRETVFFFSRNSWSEIVLQLYQLYSLT